MGPGANLVIPRAPSATVLSPQTALRAARAVPTSTMGPAFRAVLSLGPTWRTRASGPAPPVIRAALPAVPPQAPPA